MTRVIAVANQKGGVGKTVTSINLAAYLANRGRKTLLIDLDPQGHCGIGMGFDIEDAQKTSYELLVDPQVSIEQCAVPVPIEALGGNLSFIPANLKLSLADRELEKHIQHPNLVLARKLRPIRGYYDEIVLDCPPALSKLTLNAFLASNIIVIPISVSYFSIQGVRMLAETLRDIFEETGLDYQIRCLITRFRPRQTVSVEVDEAARTLFGEFCFETRIRDCIDVEKSVGAQLPLIAYSKRATAARDYAALADEILAIEATAHAFDDDYEDLTQSDYADEDSLDIDIEVDETGLEISETNSAKATLATTHNSQNEQIQPRS